MIHIEEQVHIAQPLPEVFAFLEEITNHPRFSEVFSHTQNLTEGPFGLGSRVRKVSAFFGQEVAVEQDVVGYEPNRYIHHRIVSGPIAGEETYLFEETPTGTLLTLRLASQPPALLKFTAPLLKTRVKTQVQTDLARLKQLLEAGRGSDGMA